MASGTGDFQSRLRPSFGVANSIADCVILDPLEVGCSLLYDVLKQLVRVIRRLGDPQFSAEPITKAAY